MPAVPRPEHPRPQFQRDQWLCLNGQWEFEVDAGDSGSERGLPQRRLGGRILVPFCPESELSGVGHTDRMLAVWYRRTVEIPAAWQGREVLLHFQAVDYDATVWVNGVEVATHRGGFTPFSASLAGVAAPGTTATIVVRARDDWQGPQPRGKQSQAYANAGCHYTRTTGIWQTVWLEAVNAVRFARPRVTPDLAGSRFRLELPLVGDARGHRIRVRLRDGKTEVASESIRADGDFAPTVDLRIPGTAKRWSPEDPHLYGLELELLDAAGARVDHVRSYAGLRSVTIRGRAILINGERVFQRLVLDQGYWPDGIMTAPSDAALIRDIELAKEAGFNGARLHQKVFEERFLYHADRLGWLCWGEFADWGDGHHGRRDEDRRLGPTFVAQWLEAVERDYSHPSIVGWCPLNEHGHDMDLAALEDGMRALVLATRAADRTRPVLDVSGWAHRVRESDVFDSHDYDQDPESFRERHRGLAQGNPFVGICGGATPQVAYRGQPYFVSEFGGIWWNPDAKPGDASWGYGERPRTEEEFYRRFEGLCAALLDDPEMFGYCYTQLTDVFQEQNGVVRFDRSPKLDLARLRRAQQRPAAYELVAEPAFVELKTLKSDTPRRRAARSGGRERRLVEP